MRDFASGIYIVLILVILASSSAAQDYFYNVTSRGITIASISFEKSANISLPDDVASPDIKGGTYRVTDVGISAIAKNETARISYISSFHTKKEQGIWYFETLIVNAHNTTVILPRDVQVVQSIPRASITKDVNVMLTWNDLSSKNISISYVYIVEPIPDQKKPSNNTSGIIALIIFLCILTAFGTASYLKKKTKPKQVEPNDLPRVTDAQMHVLRAANQNEALVLRLLLKHNGHMKRNNLEKESALSKSSLASALKNLERKNLIDIDRSFHVHYITLTSWFKDLK